MKTCSTCKLELNRSEFARNAKSKDGLQWRCKSCTKRWYADNKVAHTKNVTANKQKSYVERLCVQCGQEFKQAPERRSAKCGVCIAANRRVPCPHCEQPMKKEARSCQDCTLRSGAASPTWKDGTTRHSKGYVLVHYPNNGRNAGNYVFEHILVMEEFLGRRLLSHENVHHKNGVRCDNRISNLELWSKSQPAGQRVEDKVEWAKEILALYEQYVPPK